MTVDDRWMREALQEARAALLADEVPVGAVVAGFVTEFDTAGINQTRHKVSMTLTAQVQLVIPTGASRVEAMIQVAVAESIIVGAVPESFTDVGGNMEMLDLAP